MTTPTVLPLQPIHRYESPSQSQKTTSISQHSAKIHSIISRHSGITYHSSAGSSSLFNHHKTVLHCHLRVTYSPYLQILLTMMSSPPIPSQARSMHSPPLPLRAQSSTTKLDRHLSMDNSVGTPSTKPCGTNCMQTKSSDSAKVGANMQQNLINNGFRELTPCGPSCSTTSHMSAKVMLHTHKLSVKYNPQKPTQNYYPCHRWREYHRLPWRLWY